MKTQNPPFTLRFTSSDIGCIIDCSYRSADDFNRRLIGFAADYGFGVDVDTRKLLSRFEYDVTLGDDSETLSLVADEAMDYLQDAELPPYCYFIIDDNSLFLAPCVENAQEDVGFVSSKDAEYPDDDYEGEWLHVNDHGNATLYCRGLDGDGKVQDDEIWSIV